MNYHSDEWIIDRVKEHYDESLNYFKEDSIIGVFLQGSQNYGLDYEDSDIDTKEIVLPTLSDIIYNKKPISTTHIRENDEHTDWKDIRLYMQTFLKQNPNFIEILFTPYSVINKDYVDEWNILVQNRELIAHLNPYLSVNAMWGVATQKYHAMEHEFEGKMEVLKKYGYDPKQLHHLLRIQEMVMRYIRGDSYEDCLHTQMADYLIDIKKGILPLEQARETANNVMDNIQTVTDKYLNSHENKMDEGTKYIMDSVQYKIMKKAIKKEIG